METVDIYNGTCSQTLWTLSMDSMDFFHGHRSNYPCRHFSDFPWKKSTESMDILQTGESDTNNTKKLTCLHVLQSPGPGVIKLFPSSTQLSTKF